VYKLKFGIAKLTETGSRTPSFFGEGPETLEQGGLNKILKNLGVTVVESVTASLTPEEKKEYGAWHKLGLASRYLADIVAYQNQRNIFTLGFLSNCNGPLRVGLLWIDAHGDFNTPETTLSGMLGGMPVAISTGLCLHRLRMKCGLDPPLPSRYVTMVGVRDTDPLEQELLDRSEVQHITVEHVKNLSPVIDLEMERLAVLTDLTYIHVDMDVLNPEEVPGHDLTVEDGPTSLELASALELMFEHPSAQAFGIASYPVCRDPDGVSLKAAYNLINGVVRGLKSRRVI
jgi:arginase